MGFRTLVMLYNDQADQWSKDALLGQKIAKAMNFAAGSGTPRAETSIGYGQVVECTHADQQTLAVVDSYTFTSIAHQIWLPNPKDEMKIALLKDAADAMGYKLVKK